VFIASGAVRNGRPSFHRALRWTREPLTWRRFSRTGPKLRATARRAFDSARVLASPPATPSPPARPAGYLLRSATSQTIPLHAGVHPVTGDQLLSTDPAEGERLGYEAVALLGHLIARAPVTGTLGPIRPTAPWTTRFGLVTPPSLHASHETQLRMRRPSLAGLPAPELSGGFSIRAGDESDLAVWAEIMNGDMGYWDEARARWEFWADPDLLEGGVQLLVDHRGEIRGTATAKRSPTDSSTGYLHMVAVAPRLRGCGLGTAISLAALRRMADAKLDAVVLDTDDWRLAAIRTYLRLGFQPDPVAEDHEARWRRILKIV
jgi:mycothiol synthase